MSFLCQGIRTEIFCAPGRTLCYKAPVTLLSGYVGPTRWGEFMLWGEFMFCYPVQGFARGKVTHFGDACKEQIHLTFSDWHSCLWEAGQYLKKKKRSCRDHCQESSRQKKRQPGFGNIFLWNHLTWEHWSLWRPGSQYKVLINTFAHRLQQHYRAVSGS